MRPTLIAVACLGAAAFSAAVWLRGSALPARWASRRVGPPAQLPYGLPESGRGQWLTIHQELVVDRHQVRGLDCCATEGGSELVSPALVLPAGHPALHALRAVPVEVVIAKNGQIAEARILGGPHTPSIEQALQIALRGWRFEPVRLKKDGMPVDHFAWTSVGLEPAAETRTGERSIPPD